MAPAVVKCKIVGGKVALDFEISACSTVRDLKENVSGKTKLDMDRQTLTCCGEEMELENLRSLESHGYAEEAVIRLDASPLPDDSRFSILVKSANHPYATISVMEKETVADMKANISRLLPIPASTRPRPTKFQVKAASINARELIQSGAVRPIPPKEAAMAMSSEGFILLDIRPDWERDKARVAGSLHVPLFVKDMDSSPITLLKKWVHFGYVGLWTGQNFTTLNADFLRQVEAEVPDKDAKLLVACGEGLRSIMAASKLYAGGFRNLGWLAGGFNRSADSDFPAVEGSEKLQYATIGGVSYFFLQLLILLRAVGKDD